VTRAISSNRIIPLLRRPIVRVCLASSLAVCSSAALATQAFAASAEVAIIANNPPPPPTASGSASSYTINFSCSSVSGLSCGASPTITIPLHLTSSNPATPPMSSWGYSVSSPIAGLILSEEVVGEDFVVGLDESKLVPGDSDTVRLAVTPPNDITPGGTAWSLTPSFETASIPSVTAPAPALGEAAASTKLSLSKSTSDGGAVYVRGNNVIYNIVARCNPGDPKGSLFLTTGGLIDTLPPGLNFVSATPAPTSAPTPGEPGPITWSYPTAASLPNGCSATAGGAQNYQVVANIDPATPENTQLINSVTLEGTPIGETTPLQTSASRPITAITVAPGNPGGFLGKSAQGPLNIPGAGFKGTYAGNWIRPINPRPGSAPGSAEGRYTVTIKYPASRAYETDLADPVPCLENLSSGVVYSSNTPSGPIDGPGSIDNLCQHPAFNPTVVQVSSASLEAAIAGGWTPTGIRPDGSTFALTREGKASSSTFFEVPAADIGDVAAIEIGRNPNLTDVGMSMDVWGYGDVSLLGGDVLRDIATATAYPFGGAAPTTLSTTADLAIEPTAPQLGVTKSFGPLGEAPGGTTALTLTGNLATPSPIAGDLVMTDLLAFGLSWHNPVSTATFTLTAGRGGPASPIVVTLEDIPNFAATGRELIRVRFPASAFVSGFYTLSPPTDLIDLNVPSGAITYHNTAQTFVAGIGQNTSPACGPGTASTPSTFQSSDPLDLDGDGITAENYCEWATTLTVPPQGGPAFSLVKSVQGDLDPTMKFPPGIGEARVGGGGVYALQWINTGGKELTNPVIYDILPHPGDTGVSQGQAGSPRESQFATTFAGISGALAPGVIVQYSTSTNPCRPQVFPNAANPGCVNDWSSEPPSDLGTVTALEFSAPGQTYMPGESFTVTFAVQIPLTALNLVAWNSAASAADFNGNALLPAEPPKVGLTAHAGSPSPPEEPTPPELPPTKPPVSPPSTPTPEGGVASIRLQSPLPLRITKTTSTPVIHAGSPAHYTIKISNQTQTTASDVLVCDRLPAGIVFVSASVKTHPQNGERCWTITTLAPGKTRAFTVTARSLAGASGMLSNLASVSGPHVVTAHARASVRVLGRKSPGGGVTG
jgi:uncharacterized repeat protein (TIGR01451 family)